MPLFLTAEIMKLAVQPFFCTISTAWGIFSLVQPPAYFDSTVLNSQQQDSETEFPDGQWSGRREVPCKLLLPRAMSERSEFCPNSSK